MLLLLPLIFNIAGAQPQDPDFRIVGGHPVSITERPFQVLLYRVIHREAMPDCGGSIIHSKWILTAAHCVWGAFPENLHIRAGTDNFDDDGSMAWYGIRKIIPHEGFEPTSETARNDIALLMTEVEIQFSHRVKPVELARKSPAPNSEAVISGFGVTQEGSTIMSKSLIAVSVTVLDRADCIDLLADVSKELRVSNTHFCAAYLAGGRDACQGDSGGPVTIGNSLAGIVSWGIGCAEKMVPAFYTDVSLFKNWIDDKMKKYSSRTHKIIPANYRIKKHN